MKPKRKSVRLLLYCYFIILYTNNIYFIVR